MGKKQHLIKQSRGHAAQRQHLAARPAWHKLLPQHLVIAHKGGPGES